MLKDVEIFVNQQKGEEFLHSLQKKQFLFSLVISYTETSTIPGITVAGKNPALVQFTPPADAEYLNFGYCKCINLIPMTPDGKPTPALLTKTALESASIPNVVINAGSKIPPMLPYFECGLPYGKNIAQEPAMSQQDVMHAVEYGRMIGRSLGSTTDCLIIGESIPGGTTTAQAVLASLGISGQVSSSMQQNPVSLKSQIVDMVIRRNTSRNPFDVLANAADPMIATVTGILGAASSQTKVILAGGTQMAAVLAVSKLTGYNKENTAIATTSYIIQDNTANLVEMVDQIDQVPVISVKLGLENSEIDGLRTFSEGYVKEGVGAGGASLAAMLKVGIDSSNLLELAQKQYRQLTLQ